jgi:hypothetical protein
VGLEREHHIGQTRLRAYFKGGTQSLAESTRANAALADIFAAVQIRGKPNIFTGHTAAVLPYCLQLQIDGHGPVQNHQDQSVPNHSPTVAAKE